MTLSQQHRTVIFEHCVTALGEETAEAFMAEFPTNDGDELVTKQFLRAEMAELRGEMHTGMAELRGELHTGMADLRGEMISVSNRTMLVIVPSIIAGLGMAAAIT